MKTLQRREVLFQVLWKKTLKKNEEKGTNNCHVVRGASCV